MDTFLYLIYALLFIFLDVFAYYRLLNNKLTFRFSNRKLIPAYTFVYALYFMLGILSDINIRIPLKFIFLLLFFVALYMLYNDTAFKRILWITITFFALFTCELLLLPVFMLITGSSFDDISGNPTFEVWGTLFSRLLLLIFIEFIIRTKKKITQDFFKNYFFIIFTDAVFAIIIFNFFYVDNIYLTSEIAIFICMLALFIISVLSLYLLRKITKKSEEILTTNLKLQQIEMEHKQNQDIAIIIEELRSLRHDMNNHMSVLQGLLSMKEYDEAKAYLTTITQELSVANDFIFTDNKVLSILLNNKIGKARQHGITVDTELLTTVTPFSDRDLCTVIGNIFENAIEAATNHEQPYIFFSLKRNNGTLLIQCDNTYTITPIFDGANLLTTKSDKAYHGIGTKNIRTIVEHYQGTVDFSVDAKFHVYISIPL